jgi:hypothetical protein
MKLRATVGWLVFAQLSCLAIAMSANAQVFQQGGVVPQHLTMWSTNNTVMDAGGAADRPQGLLPHELGLTAPANKSGNPFPAAASGSGPNGENLCLYDSPLGTPGHYLCVSANAGANTASIAVGAIGGAASSGLQISLNGTVYPFPGPGGGNVVGPTSPSAPAGSIAVWNGGLTLKDGKLPGTIGAVGILNAGAADWLSTYAYGYVNTPVASLSSTGQVAVVGGSRNTDNNGGVNASIGLLGWNFNFNTATPAAGWGIYSESRRIDGAGTAQAMELDATQLGAVVSITPYNMNPGGQAISAWLASGGGCGVGTFRCFNGTTNVAANAASAAIGITDNGAPFNKGIVFHNTALGADGATATAIDLARRHQIVWETPNGPGAIIRSDILDSTVYGTSSLLFIQGTNAGVLQTLLSGIQAMEVTLAPSGSGNYASFNLAAGQTGVNSAISLNGADANLSLELIPKGTGVIVIGGNGGLVVPGMVTSCTGAAPGTLWNSSGAVHIC